MSDENGNPPILSMAESAVAAHEYYCSLRNSGFDSQQSLYLTGVMMVQNPGTPPPGVEDKHKD